MNIEMSELMCMLKEARDIALDDAIRAIESSRFEEYTFQDLVDSIEYLKNN